MNQASGREFLVQFWFSGTGGGVAAQSDAPSCGGQRKRGNCHHRNQRRINPELRASEQASRWIKCRETEWNNPAQEKLDVTGINGERIPPERQQIPKRGMNSNAILEPERKRRKKEKHGDVNDAAAKREERQ